MKMKTLSAALAFGFAAGGAFAQAQTGPVRIGFITDMASLYADIDGPAGAEMVKWAVEDFGGKVLNRPIEVLTPEVLERTFGASVDVLVHAGLPVVLDAHQRDSGPGHVHPHPPGTQEHTS